MRQLFSLVMLSGLSLALSGCVEHISEREGAEIQVVPVTYSVGISIKKDQKEKAREELDRYVQEHWDKVTTQTVTLQWYTPEGKDLADDYYQFLLGKGVDKNKVSMEKAQNSKASNTGNTTNAPFDMTLQTVVNRSVVEICDYEKVGLYGLTKQGCYTDGARWQSMVYPEKMLSTGQKRDPKATQSDRM